MTNLGVVGRGKGRITLQPAAAPGGGQEQGQSRPGEVEFKLVFIESASKSHSDSVSEPGI